MKEKKNSLSIPLNSESSSNFGESSELEDLENFSSELGLNDSVISFNEAEFYKEKTSFLSQLFFCWTFP